MTTDARDTDYRALLNTVFLLRGACAYEAQVLSTLTHRPLPKAVAREVAKQVHRLRDAARGNSAVAYAGATPYANDIAWTAEGLSAERAVDEVKTLNGALLYEAELMSEYLSYKTLPRRAVVVAAIERMGTAATVGAAHGYHEVDPGSLGMALFFAKAKTTLTREIYEAEETAGE
jgi:hypothetical protein